MQRTWIYCLGLLAILAFPSLAQTTFPLNDVSSPRSQCYAFINAHIVKDANTEWPKASLVIRKGKIEQVGPQVTIPKEAVIIDLKGKYVYPSFIDAYSDYGSPEVKPGGAPLEMPFKTSPIPKALMLGIRPSSRKSMPLRCSVYKTPRPVNGEKQALRWY